MSKAVRNFIGGALGKTGNSSRTMATGNTKLHGIVNDLQFEKSPYLLQHKTNPVEWHPWSSATHELAVSRSQPIFLSIGYSTCHWCHVMERESFENPEIAAIMNKHFVNVKVDREEHPDIDRIYMSFVQAVSGSGGWPLSVWLTPSLKPFYGGTYYPPDNRYFGRPGFKSLLLSIAEQWDENKEKCEESGVKIIELLKKSCAASAVEDVVPDGGKVLDKCVAQLKRSYEPSFGGFSEAPKFPQPCNLFALIDHCAKKRDGEEAVRKIVERTLTMMAQGGIHDHVGQGFARYSTDKKWHVPHFEKMLYDQAQLAEAYALTNTLTKNEFFANVTRDILEYVLRDLSHADGGFFSAEDADSENSDGAKREGAFYVWTGAEIDTLLREIKVRDVSVGDLFKFRYGVKDGGNVDPYQDPHDELKNQNVLFEANNVAKCAEKFGLEEGEVVAALDSAKNSLFTWRNLNRKRPGLDDKIIASWNGLMIKALCTASMALGESEYVDRAVKAMKFCEKHLIMEDGDVLRTCYAEGKSGVANLSEPIRGCVDDFANLVSACIGLFQATGGDAHWVELARKLQAKQDALFWDDERGGYFNGRVHASVVVRMKDDDDGAEPSSNSTSLRNLLQLSQIDAVFSSPDAGYVDKIPKLVKQFGDRLQKIPIALPLMSSLLHTHTSELATALVYDGRDVAMRTAIGKSVILPLGSVLVPVSDPDSVEGLVPGKILRVKGSGARDVVDNVSDCV